MKEIKRVIRITWKNLQSILQQLGNEAEEGEEGVEDYEVETGVTVIGWKCSHCLIKQSIN